jgi:antitoxin component of RelBE/YafQ-DinJ toxin-antitoxin module
MSKKPKGTAIPIRFEKEEWDHLTAISEKTGISRTQIVRLAVKLLLAHVAKTGSLPINPPFECAQEDNPAKKRATSS